MKHISIKMDRPIEIINVTPINPLISKCQIKVCWVGPEPNRNRSIITKEVALDLANSLPGSPIVGYYLEDVGDFDEHSRVLEIKDGELVMKDITRPYGFVDLNAKCWFEWFMDDGINAREYLVTEGYLWTGQYPEAKRIMENGNNHSMELDEEIIDAHWTKDENGKNQFFIINEAIISKLCILGENEEPCFEGSQITPVINFSLEEDFKAKMFSMMESLKQILSEGGMKMEETKIITETPEVVEEEVAEDVEFKKKEEEKEDKTEKTDDNKTEDTTEEKVEDDEEEKKKKAEFSEEKCPECGKPLNECECEKPTECKGNEETVETVEENKQTYVLEEIVEYTDLLSKYSALEAQVNSLIADKENLEAQLAPLVAFKNAADLKEKENMIASFYMLSDDDKKDVVENINSYSVDEIEAKLSVICVRNKVSFALDEETRDEKDPITFNLNDVGNNTSNCPGWLKAVEAVAASKNK